MTYAVSDSLQRAVYQQLIGDPGVVAQVGTAVFDAAAPQDAEARPDLYISLGPEKVWDAGSKTSAGARHDFTVTVHSNQEGFVRAKAAAGAVCDALVDAALTLTRGHLVGMRFLYAQATRGRAPERRKIELRFRAFVDDI